MASAENTRTRAKSARSKTRPPSVQQHPADTQTVAPPEWPAVDRKGNILSCRKKRRPKSSRRKKKTKATVVKKDETLEHALEVVIRLSVSSLKAVEVPLNMGLPLPLSRVLLRFYTSILRDEEQLLDGLNQSHRLPGITCERIDIDLMAIVCNADTVPNLQRLVQATENGHLATLVSKVLAPPDILHEIGARVLELRTSVSPDDITLLSTSTDSADLCEKLDDLFLQDKDLKGVSEIPVESLSLLNKVYSDVSRDLDILNQQSIGFSQNSMKDFLWTLKLIKPVDLKTITCVSSISRCYELLQNSPSVGKQLHTSLVGEYLDMIDAIRCLLKKLLEIKDIVLAHNVGELYGQCLSKMATLEDLLNPQYTFDQLSSRESVQDMSVMDRKCFGSLAHYLPTLMDTMKSALSLLKQFDT